jgi:hypothetical protein
LPESALSDELSSLHQRLTTCVEEQIEHRREDVDNWMKKCDVIEKECLRYNKALGGHTKALSTSLGELKKQKALPVRHEMLNQHLEKLDHVRDFIASVAFKLNNIFFVVVQNKTRTAIKSHESYQLSIADSRP